MFNPLTAIQDAVLARHVPEVSAQRRDRKREWLAHCLHSLKDAELTQGATRLVPCHVSLAVNDAHRTVRSDNPVFDVVACTAR